MYLSIKAREHVKRSFIFSTLTIPAGLAVDYTGHITKHWISPNTIFPFKLLGVVPIEDLLWAFFLTYFVVIFYEYFIDKHITKKAYEPKFKYLYLIFLFLSLGLIFMVNNVRNIPYFYLIGGIVGLLIPVLCVKTRLPNLWVKISKVFAYFFYLGFIYEITAVALDWWYFPEGSAFIGWIEVFEIRFPIEEFIFWIMLWALAVLSYFEYFDDDAK